MRVLITGATGHIGHHVLSRLIRAGDDVRILALPGTEDHLPPDAGRVFLGTLDDVNMLKRAARHCDVVYHLAGLYPHNPVKEMVRVNVGGTQNLLRASVEAGVRRFIYISSTSVYRKADLKHGKLISEGSPVRTNNHGPFGNYSLTKIAAEQLIEQCHAQHNLEYVILRPSEIYGPARRYFERLISLVAHRPRLALFLSEQYGDMQWVHMNDFVQAVWLAGSIRLAPNDKFNIAGSEAFTVQDLIPIVWKLMERENWRVNVLSAGSDLTQQSQLIFDCTKARSILKFNPKTTLQQGLRALVLNERGKPE